MDEDGGREFVRGAYTFSAKLHELSEHPKYLPSSFMQDGRGVGPVSRTAPGLGEIAKVSRWLSLFANVVYAFAEAVEVELGRDPDPDPDPRK